MSSLRDQIIANADPKKPKTFIHRMSIDCQMMIAEGMLLFRQGKLPIGSFSELMRSLERIAEKNHQEDLAKWPDATTAKRFYGKVTDQELLAIAKQQVANPKGIQKQRPKTSRTK